MSAATIAATVLAYIAVSALAGAAVGLVLRRRQRADSHPDDLERFLGWEIAAHTRRPDDQSLSGTLVGVGPVWLEFARARYLTPQGEQPLEGVALVDRRHVAYLQPLSPAGGAVLERR